MSVHIQLHNSEGVFTNLDVISGRVILSTNREETFGSITVKLECESRTRLTAPRDQYSRGRDATELEVHKLLYKTVVGGSFTIPAGHHEWPFQFKIPFNNACVPVHSVFDRVQMANDPTMQVAPFRHVKRALPPSLTGFPGEADIRYYVKATAQRAAFYKENFRTVYNFQFFPIEPVRPPPNRRESFARRQFQFAPYVPLPQKTNLFKKQVVSGPGEGAPPPSISIDGRLPDPPILTCNEAIPLRVVVKKLNDTTEQLFLQIFQIVLMGHTKIRCHQLTRTEPSSWVIISRANMNIPLGDKSTPANEEIELDPRLWKQTPLLNSICPTFDTCNISRTYELEISVGLVYGSAGKIKPELTVQRLRMPCTLYSGIRPPAALLEEVAKFQSASQSAGKVDPYNQQPHPTVPPTTAQTPQPVATPDGPSPQYTPAAPGPLPDGPPPSYDDAMADDLGPVDGPRREYEQPQSSPVVGDNKRSLFGR